MFLFRHTPFTSRLSSVTLSFHRFFSDFLFPLSAPNPALAVFVRGWPVSRHSRLNQYACTHQSRHFSSGSSQPSGVFQKTFNLRFWFIHLCEWNNKYYSDCSVFFSESRTAQSSPCGVLERAEKGSKGTSIYYSLLITPTSSLSISLTLLLGCKKLIWVFAQATAELQRWKTVQLKQQETAGTIK